MATNRPLFPGKRIEGKGLLYGAIHPFSLPGWTPAESHTVVGPNWQVIFKPDGAQYVSLERGGQIIERTLEGPNVLIAGTDSVSDPAEAVRVQKPVVDAIRGLLLLAGPPGKSVFLPPVWEGVLRKPSPGRIAFEVHRVEATALDMTLGRLKHWGEAWGSIDPLLIPKELGFGLRWYYKGLIDLHNMYAERVDGFVGFWLCIITIVRAWHAQHVGGDPPEVLRFRAYSQSRLGLDGDGLEEKVSAFKEVSDRRNSLFKGGGGMAVTEKEAALAAELAHMVLDFETLHLR